MRLAVSLVRPLLSLLPLTLAACASGGQSGEDNFPQPAVCDGVPPSAPATQMISVRGHALAVAEAGDPAGFPLFYAHGNPGSRLELALLDADARRHGYRLISFDRPGFGQSPYLAPYSLKDFADDTVALADLKGLARFGLIGWSSGGPPVLAVANYYLQRVVFTFSIAGYTDFSRFPDARQFMADHGLPGSKMAEKRPLLFDLTIWGVRRADLHRPDFYLRTAREEMPAFDKQQLEAPAHACLFMRTQQEGLRQGSDGAVQDLKVQWQAWDYDMSKLAAPVEVVQGQVDPFVPYQFGQHLAANLPNATLHLLPEKGHLLPFSAEFRAWLFGRADSLRGKVPGK